MKLVGKKEFVTAALNLKDETFVVYVTSLINSNAMHLPCKVQIVLLKINKVLITVLLEYSNFVNVFFPKLVVEI